MSTQVDHDNDWIKVHVAARPKYLGLSVNYIERLCRQGVFPSAHKTGVGRNSHWRILRSEVLAHRMNGYRREL